jgi:hypothetical protein
MMPEQHLAQAADAFKMIEYSSNRFLHFEIGRHVDSAGSATDVTHGRPGHHLSPEDLLSISLLSPLPQNAQFEFAHRPLQSQKQPVVQNARIVDPIRVHHEGLSQHT